MIRNVHERGLRVPVERAGVLLDALGGPDDRLWPAPAWPRLRLDRPVQEGASGGHGPIRYAVEARSPGRLVRFRFAQDLGLEGTHTFVVLPVGDGSVLRHELEARARGRMRLAWPLAVRWLHDALLEDLLDRAQAEVGSPPARPAQWSVWVRLLRTAYGVVARASS